MTCKQAGIAEQARQKLKDRIIELESQVGVALETIKHQRETIETLGQQNGQALRDIEKSVDENKRLRDTAHTCGLLFQNHGSFICPVLSEKE